MTPNHAGRVCGICGQTIAPILAENYLSGLPDHVCNPRLNPSPRGILQTLLTSIDQRPPLLTNEDQRPAPSPTPAPRPSPVPTRTVYFSRPSIAGGMQSGGGPPTPTVLDGLGLRRHQLPSPPPVRPVQRRNRLDPILEEIMSLRNAASRLGVELQELYRRLDRELADQLEENARSRDSPSDN